MSSVTLLLWGCALVLTAMPAPAQGGSAHKPCYKSLVKLRYWRLSIKPDKLRIEYESGLEDLSYFDAKSKRHHKPPRRPILLLHGFTADKESWLGVARKLRRDHRVVALDLAGHGDSSDAADGDYGLASQAERAHLLAQSLELGQYHVLGHSMGGGVAVALALAYPAEVSSLGLVAPAIKAEPHTAEFSRYLRGESEDKPGIEINPLIVGEGWTDRERVRYVTSGPWWLHMFSRFSSCVSQPNEARKRLYPTIFRQLAPTEPRAPFSDEELARIHQPIQILWGKADRVLRPDPGYLSSRVGGEVTTEEWPGVGHTPIIEDSRRTATAYLEFLERHRGLRR